jgi:hypothetical protein
MIQHIDRRDIIHTVAADIGTASTSTREEVRACNDVSSYRRRSPQPARP